MDPRTGLDALRIQKIICPCRQSNNYSTVVHPVTQSYLRGIAKGNHEKFVRIVSVQAMTRNWLLPIKVRSVKTKFPGVILEKRIGFIDISYIGLFYAAL